MAEKKSLFVNGGNGGQIVTTGNPITDLERAQDVARRYRCEFVDLTDFQLHHELFKKIPVPSSVWWTRPFLLPCSGVPRTSTSRLATTRLSSSSASMACSRRPCRP